MEHWEITYAYAESGLLIAYGVSLICTLICAIVGFHAFSVNDASYQNIFSTFLRATNDLEIRSNISSGDMGSDPLPKGLAKTAITLGGRKAIDGSVHLTVGKVKTDDLELQPLRPECIETSWNQASSVRRESLAGATAPSDQSVLSQENPQASTSDDTRHQSPGCSNKIVASRSSSQTPQPLPETLPTGPA